MGTDAQGRDAKGMLSEAEDMIVHGLVNLVVQQRAYTVQVCERLRQVEDENARLLVQLRTAPFAAPKAAKPRRRGKDGWKRG